ncbi:hypothetical protein [Dapis sp. BLCC M229]
MTPEEKALHQRQRGEQNIETRNRVYIKCRAMLTYISHKPGFL